MKEPNPLPIKFLWIACRSSCCCRQLSHYSGKYRLYLLSAILKLLWWQGRRFATFPIQMRSNFHLIEGRRQYDQHLRLQQNWCGTDRSQGQWTLPRPNSLHCQYSIGSRHMESPIQWSNRTSSSPRRNRRQMWFSRPRNRSEFRILRQIVNGNANKRRN